MTRPPSIPRIGLTSFVASLLAACAAPPEPARQDAPTPSDAVAKPPATPEPPPTAQTSSRIAGPSDPPLPTTALPTMPRLRERPNAFMTALLAGTLREQDGCLRVSASAGDPGHLVVWQPEYTLHRAGDRLEIHDAAGKPVARVGDPISMGGGEVPLDDHLKKQLAAPIPAACKGPYWVMGSL